MFTKSLRWNVSVWEKFVMIIWWMTHILYKLSENLWLSQIILILLHHFNDVLK